MNKSLKSSLKQWVGKIFKHENKPKRFMKDVASKITACNLKESKTQLEDIIAEDLFNKIDEIRKEKGNPEIAYEILEHFLNDNSLGTSLELKSQMVNNLINFFNSNVEDLRNLEDSLQNVYSPTSNTFDCICPKASKDLLMPQRIQSCYRCRRICHTNCLWGPQEYEEQYQCPLCFGSFCLPNRRVQEVLFGGYLRQTKKDKIQYKINLPLKNALKQDQAMQVRCMRLGKNKYELTWPQNCLLFFNQKKIAQLKPLPISSSLKRRIDQQIVFDKKMISAENVLIIEERHQYIQGIRSANSQNHFLIVVIVQILSSNVVEQQLMKKRLRIQQSKQQLKQYILRGSQDSCFIQKIGISLKCQFYGMNVMIPVRSKHCRSHFQTFDLKNFILANNNSKNASQKWKCPVCKKRAYDIQVDQYLLSIINKYPQESEFQFNRQAQLKLPQKNNSFQSKKYQQSEQGSENPLNMCQELFVKKQSKSLHPNKFQPISIDQLQQGSVQPFHECIQLDDTPQQNYNKTIQRKSRSLKRSYRARSKQKSQKKPIIDTLKKKKKCDNNETNRLIQELPSVKSSSSVQQLQSIQSKSLHSDIQSQYCEGEEELFNDNRKKQRKIGNYQRRARVQNQNTREMQQQMAKKIMPSPNIRTVIPEAIRINEVRLPQPKKSACQQPTIQIIDQEEQTIQTIKKRKLQYNKNELQRLQIQISRNEADEMPPKEEKMFWKVCEKFILSFGKG